MSKKGFRDDGRWKVWSTVTIVHSMHLVLITVSLRAVPRELIPFLRTPEVIAVIIILTVSKEAKPRKDKYLAQTSCSRKSLDSMVTEFMLATLLLCYGLILTTQQYGVGKYIPREEWLGHNCSFVLLLFQSLTVKGRYEEGKERNCIALDTLFLC